MRYSKAMCNQQSCVGDEICVANQDLAIAIDGSGSVREAGFDILKKFVEKLLERYQTMYWGAEAVKLGIVLFDILKKFVGKLLERYQTMYWGA